MKQIAMQNAATLDVVTTFADLTCARRTLSLFSPTPGPDGDSTNALRPLANEFPPENPLR